MKHLSWFVTMISFLALATAANAQEQPNPITGSHLYVSYCIVCHGKDGTGKGPLAFKRHIKPADLTQAKYQNKELEDLAALIGGYRPMEDATLMPNWGVALPKEELIDVAAYVLRLTRKDLKLIGDTRRGRVIYKGACASCHGRFGKGDGLLAQLIRVEMGDFTKRTDMEGVTDEKLVKVISEGKGEFMPAWAGTLSNDEVYDVAAYVRLMAK